MGSRIAATVVLVIGLGALLWVAFGGTSTDSATEVPVSTTSSASGESDAPEAPGTPDAPDAIEAAPATPASTDDSSPAEPTSTPPTPEPDVDVPENFGARMDLVEIDGWLNTDATSLDDFNGKVILVEMWTFGCFNCKARIPFNQSYYEEFAGENFEIVGVHAPEFDYEADVANIIEAAENLGVNWPIALDTNKKNFRAWQPGSTNFWPRTYVIDQNGDIRYDHIGEGKYEELRETIRFLIENPPPAKTNP